MPKNTNTFFEEKSSWCSVCMLRNKKEIDRSLFLFLSEIPEKLQKFLKISDILKTPDIFPRFLKYF
jgi:hypothetical protein